MINNQIKVYKILIGAFLFLCLWMLAIQGFFLYRFHHYQISPDISDWGSFGDFFGGVFNPVIALYSILLLGFITYLVSRQSTEDNLDLNLRLRRMDAYNEFAEFLPVIQNMVWNMADTLAILSSKLDGKKGSDKELSLMFIGLGDSVKESIELMSKFGLFMSHFNVKYGHLFEYNFQNSEYETLKDTIMKMSECSREILTSYYSMNSDLNTNHERMNVVQTKYREIGNLFNVYSQPMIKLVNELRDEL